MLEITVIALPPSAVNEVVPVASLPIALAARIVVPKPREAPAAVDALVKIVLKEVLLTVYSVVNVLPCCTKDTLILSVDLISNVLPLRSYKAVNAELLAVVEPSDWLVNAEVVAVTTALFIEPSTNAFPLNVTLALSLIWSIA